MSSAHVYVRLHKFKGIDDISEGLLEDCAQLVKANSIQVRKKIKFTSWIAHLVKNVDVVYTPWQNLKKTASMDVGQVGFHNSKMRILCLGQLGFGSSQSGSLFARVQLGFG
ncbi:hypothetical protein POM88_003972 [Heracleum sosnowskyi]|uniref:NFACT RNA-binding domain-containing protein n=1 Tax=Heracleum sosnowskyi TaxID=360622 RepID=A0AAD8JKT7_9APIA|nr:hypothetical protein POM88_003972 [Heracleum sosnowskyi]